MNQIINKISFVLLFGLTGCYSAIDCVCPDLYNPVCGANGENYANPCSAECEKMPYTYGECPVTAIGTGKFTGDTLCGFIIQVLDQKYKSQLLADEFKKNGIIVTVRYRRLIDVYDCLSQNISYQEINILSIEEFP